MAAPLAYVHLDHNDRAFFDHALASDAHRFAFIKFMEHVEDRYAKNKSVYSMRFLCSPANPSKDPELEMVGSSCGTNLLAHIGSVVRSNRSPYHPFFVRHGIPLLFL